MNAKTLVPLIIAIVLGVVAAKVGKDMMSKRGQAGATTRSSKLVVAKEDIAIGAEIKELDLTLGASPLETPPPSTFGATSELVGRVVTAPIAKGQPIYESLLAPRGSAGGLSALIPQGLRAVTLEVNEFSGVAGLLVPGSRVDVVQTLNHKLKDEDNGMMARTIVENLKVIAVGRRVSAAGPEPEQIARSVTVLATQEESEKIDLATHMGNPRLILRNGQDSKTGGGKGVTVAELRGASDETAKTDPLNDIAKLLLSNPTTKPVEAVKAEPPAERFREVEIIRGGAPSNVKIHLGATSSLTSGTEELKPAAAAQ